MKDDILAKRYAYAIYMIAKENDMYSQILEVMKNISKEINENKDLYKLVYNPEIKMENKLNIFSKLLGDQPKIVKNIIDYLLTKEKLQILNKIIFHYISEYNKENQILFAKAYFVQDLNNEQKEKLKEKLENKFNKKVRLDVIVDKSLIGGAIIEIDGERIDGSYKTQLVELSKSF